MTMYETLKCVVLRTIKYDDRRSIVTAWSESRGRVSLLVPAGASREARRRRALMMPLGLFEGEADIKPGRDLLSIRDLRPLRVLPDICCNPAKAVVAMFLSEALDRILREAAPDPLLSAYIFDAVELLDKLTKPVGVANFPLVFLYKLGEFLGIEPDCGSWRPGYVFDLPGGVFRQTAPTNGRWIEPADAEFVRLLDRLSFAASERLGIPRTQRRNALDMILEYYTMHHAPLSGLKSLPVVREIF